MNGLQRWPNCAGRSCSAHFGCGHSFGVQGRQCLASPVSARNLRAFACGAVTTGRITLRRMLQPIMCMARCVRHFHRSVFVSTLHCSYMYVLRLYGVCIVGCSLLAVPSVADVGSPCAGPHLRCCHDWLRHLTTCSTGFYVHGVIRLSLPHL
jgi:hypothetical protein